MTDRIMLRVNANENTVSIRTISARMKSPHHFYIGYDEFDSLQRDGRIISCDMHSFAKIWLDRERDHIVFDFTWLSEHSSGCVEGTEQAVTLRWSKFRKFLQDCRQPGGADMFRAISLDTRRGRPRITFTGSRENLRAAIGNRHIRHKLGKALMANFNWPGSEEIRLYNDFTPYSFFFREFRDGHPRLCGGLILHGQEDMGRAYYGLHT